MMTTKAMKNAPSALALARWLGVFGVGVLGEGEADAAGLGRGAAPRSGLGERGL